MNPYKVLGVKRKASDEEIKKAYRDLAKIHHPDLGGNEEKFKNISKAYTILTNPELKEEYDRTGVEPDSKNIQYYSALIDIFKVHIFSQTNEGRNIYIEAISQNLRAEIELLEVQIGEHKAVLEKLNQQKKAVRMKKKKKLNCYKEAIDSLIDDITGQLNQRKSSIKLKMKILKLADNYETIEPLKIASPTINRKNHIMVNRF